MSRRRRSAGRRPFAGRNRGGTLGAEEGIGDVAGDPQRGQIGGQPAVEPGNLGPTGGGGRIDQLTGGGDEIESEGGEGAEAKVAGGAAAEPEKDGGDAGTGGEADEFAGAGGRGEPRIAGLGREQGEAGGGGHFDHGDEGIFDFRISIFDLEESAGGGWDEGERDKTQSGDDGFAARAGYGVGFKRAAEGLGEDLAKPSPPSVSGHKSRVQSGWRARRLPAARAQAWGRTGRL